MVTTVSPMAVTSMVGRLENVLDFHVSKDEEGLESIGGLGLKGCAQNGIGLVNEGKSA